MVPRGVVIKGQEDQHVVAQYRGAEVATLTDVTIAYNDDTVSMLVDEYSPKSTLLHAVRAWVPVAGLVLGVLLAAAGVLLVLRDRRRADQPPAGQQRVPAASGR